ncbi:MAG TPA: hypothetical protein VKR59_20775 [Terriglobales bacterium]|nr:hypothetical protein [Terriglobales bacterium]
MKVQPAVVSNRNSSQVAGVAVLVSLFSFLYYFQHGDLLLYGDAVAHINIARRVFDSLTPGLLQLGTVWLPLPHVLMMPFIFPDALWQNGVGGSIPSMIAYVFAVMGIFRLARTLLEADERTKPAAGLGAWTAAFAFGANPNLMYMQATAMTETIYLAFFVWAVVYFSEFIRSLREGEDSARDSALGHDTRSSLLRCAGCLAGDELTRYDGWILAGVIGAAIVVITLSRWQTHGLRRLALKFLLLIAVAPVLWLAYNAIVYRNPLEFANGPYSAQAIEQRFQAPNPALHNAPVAALYFMKSGQLNMAIGNWGRLWLAAALVALLIVLWKLRAQTIPLLLLWVPLVFYALSIAYGSVPIHVSTWWPFATFNQRYGIQLLPMFAVSAGVLTAFVFLFVFHGAAGKRHGGKVAALVFALIAVSYFSVWKATPECLKEAQRNSDIRQPLNDAVQRAVHGLSGNSIFLMDLGEHVGVMQQAGIPLRRVVNGENHRPWKKPSDPEGLWERALADPQHYVDYVIAFDGDPVDQSANHANLRELMEIHATGQPRARIYATGRAIAPNQSR